MNIQVNAVKRQSPNFFRSIHTDDSHEFGGQSLPNTTALDEQDGSERHVDSSDEDENDLPAKRDVSAELVRGPAPRLHAERGMDDRGLTNSEPNTPTELILAGTPIVGMDASMRQEIELNSRRLAHPESLLEPHGPLFSQADDPIRAYMVSGQKESARQRLIQRSHSMASLQHDRGRMGHLETPTIRAGSFKNPNAATVSTGTTDKVDHTVSARHRLIQHSRSLAQLSQQDRKNLHGTPAVGLKSFPSLRKGFV